MKNLLIDSDKITAVLDFDRMTGAVLGKFLNYSIGEEVNITMVTKKNWAYELGVTVRTINNKLHHMKKVGVISQVDGDKHKLDGVHLQNEQKWYFWNPFK